MFIAFDSLDSVKIVAVFQKLHHLFGADYRFELYHGKGGGIRMIRYSKSETKIVKFNMASWPQTDEATLFNWDVHRDYYNFGNVSLHLTYDTWTEFERESIKVCLQSVGGREPVNLRQKMITHIRELHKDAHFMESKTHDIVIDCKSYVIVVNMVTDQSVEPAIIGMSRPAYSVLINSSSFKTGAKTIGAASGMSWLIRMNILNRQLDMCRLERPHQKVIAIKLFYDGYKI